MVQAWYQGGISVFEWTDPKHPHEIAFFDRGPNDGTRSRAAASGSVYWYNGQIIGSRDAARSRHLRADAERGDLAERDRRGEDRSIWIS